MTTLRDHAKIVQREGAVVYFRLKPVGAAMHRMLPPETGYGSWRPVLENFGLSFES